METIPVGEFGRAVRSKKTLDEAAKALAAALSERSFSVLWELDLKAKLEEKGLSGGPAFRVLEVCSAPKAKEALSIDVKVGYFLPCKMVVYREGEETVIGLLRPSVLIDFFPDAALHQLGTDVEETLVEAMVAAS